VFGVADVDVIRPEESIVLVPFRQGLPIVRLDLPTTARDQDKAWDAVSGPYGRHARPGAVLAVLCFTEDRRSAEHASQHMSNRLDGLGINTHLRLWTDGKRWREFNTGHGGLRNQTTAERIATTTVLAGAPQPAASRASGAASMGGVGTRAAPAHADAARVNRAQAGGGRTSAKPCLVQSLSLAWWTVLSWVYSLIASGPTSRPRPLCL